MALWKLRRQFYGNEEYTLKEGEELTIGRNEDNKIILTSIVISRNHCVIHVKNDKILITDLKSSNGVYVGTCKIPPNIPYSVKDSETIGFGWTSLARLVDINNREKFMFKLSKERTTSLIERIKFQNELEDIECIVANLDSKPCDAASVSPILTMTSRKRNYNDNMRDFKEEKPSIIDLISDNENEINNKEALCKKVKLETIDEEIKKAGTIKKENQDLQLEAFKIKQEYLGYDDEAILINSDSDSESESKQWILRLSQSSPGKPFVKIQRETQLEKTEESSYSQVDDGLLIDLSYSNEEENEEYLDDIIKIPEDATLHEKADLEEEYNDDGPPLISIPINSTEFEKQADIDMLTNKDGGVDLVDGDIDVNTTKQNDGSLFDAVLENLINENIKTTCLEEPSNQKEPVFRCHSSLNSASSRKKQKKQESSSKKQVTLSQKAERKKKLKELTTKNKDMSLDVPSTSSDSTQSKKPKVNAKVTPSNRGAFLTDVGIVKPTKRRESSRKSKKSKENLDKSTKQSDNIAIDKQLKEKSSKPTVKTQLKPSEDSKLPNQETRVPLKNLKPLTGEKDSFSEKPCSKVEPLPFFKPKKTVKFSEELPEVKVFQIESGNKMIKTSMVKTAHLDRLRQVPMFSLEKVTLMKVLHWNPHWLEEQLKTNDPPPILGADNPPPTIFHYFKSHAQYVKLIGDLLLMEIWECLTQAHMKIRLSNFDIPMRIECFPPPPVSGRFIDLFNISVNVSMPISELRNMPRMGEIILVTYGQEAVKNLRFFYVHNIKSLPSPPYNKNSFFSISLQTVYTDKMKFLKPGELVKGRVLAYINKELMLFNALENLANTPLCEAILKPAPEFFVNIDQNLHFNKNSQWTGSLNPSQQRAVAGALQAALGPQPALHMVQGPPGTGKSSVICAIVMSYFYDAAGKLERNRGKILICATSNAAVDELVIRLLNIRQNLPKAERFRLVRVGRAEAMAGRARDVSAAQLAARELARQRDQRPRDHHALDQEAAHLQAKINMWQTAAQDAKLPERVAYCQDKIRQLNSKIALLREAGAGAGAGSAVGAGELLAAERRVIEKADIVATTLASAHNHKMRVLKGRIALCIIEEAGQAIEPENLVPLTLDVTNLTLIGDPQQLPGYICSQRAKKHGLGESLFSRLASCAEQWPTVNPVVLLNEQYRMHREIADYPNRAFYDGKIVTCVNRKDDLVIAPYMILGINSGDKGQDAGGANAAEAWCVARVAAAVRGRLPAASLAVLTPYNAHKDLLKACLRTVLHPSGGADEADEAGEAVEVSTVDGFQGQERDVVLVSAARCGGAGFLRDAGRLAVLLTRARAALLLCLHPHALLRNHQWRTLIEDAQKRNLYRTLPNKMCQPPTTRQISPEEILGYIARSTHVTPP